MVQDRVRAATGRGPGLGGSCAGWQRSAHIAGDGLGHVRLVWLLEALLAAGGQQVLPKVRGRIREVLQAGPHYN